MRTNCHDKRYFPRDSFSPRALREFAWPTGHPALPRWGEEILEPPSFLFWSPLTTAVLPGTSQFIKPFHIFPSPETL